MRCNFIGVGRLGKNLLLALSKAGICTAASVCNRSMESSNRACLEVGFGLPADIQQLPCAEIIWITCPDDEIAAAVAKLMHNPSLNPGTYVVHCSGVLDSQVLAPLTSKGCLIASFHPLKSFKSFALDQHVFQGVDCVLEGDEQVVAWLTNTFQSLGAHIIKIQPQAKVLYHAAACMAANYLITLAAASSQLLQESGIDEKEAQKMLGKLMQGTITNLQQSNNLAEALTGPLMRGDIETLTLHLNAIKNPEIKKLYQTAGLATLEITTLSEEKKNAIKQLLQRN